MPRIYIGKYFEADFVEDFQKKKNTIQKEMQFVLLLLKL